MKMCSTYIGQPYIEALILEFPILKQRSMGPIICLAAKDGEMMDLSSLIYGQSINMI